MFGRLMAERRAKRFTQGQLAALVWPGDSNAETTRKGDISKIETGRVANPHATTVKKIADALGITPEEITELRRRAGLSQSEQLEEVPTLSRNQLELLASRFEIDKPHDRSDADLRDFLTKKAEEYRAFHTQIEAIDERTAGLGNLKGAAKDAAERLDFAEVETLLARVDEVETEIAAETKVLRAQNALMMGKADDAFRHFSAAADSFAGLDPKDPARRRVFYSDPLYEHGLRYGGAGLGHAIAMLRTALSTLTAETDPLLWSHAKNSLAAALATQGTRTEGAKGTALLAKAVTACRDALTVTTRDDRPVHWARTMQNLANVLREQGNRTEGTAGTTLLAEAVSAYRDALTITTRADHPVQWARTQENMALLELTRAAHDSCPDPGPHLQAALAHVDAALEVYDPDHMAYDHGTATRLRNQILQLLA
jgi:transcriptional regulator with XRE-family HTH domain